MYTLDIWNIDAKNDGFEKVVPFKCDIMWSTTMSKCSQGVDQ